MSIWSPPPLPPTKLGRYRTLSPLAGVRVSPLQLGAMSIGSKWHEFGMGFMDKTSSFELLNAYFDAGVSPSRALSMYAVPTHPSPGQLHRYGKQLVSLPLTRAVGHSYLFPNEVKMRLPRPSSASGLSNVASVTSSSSRPSTPPTTGVAKGSTW